MTVDHFTGQLSASETKHSAISDRVERYRAAISDAISAYTSSFFKKGMCNAAVYGDDKGVITICISASIAKLGSFYGGYWRSIYTLDVGVGVGGGDGDGDGVATEAVLAGSCKSRVHYFETGNVQMKSSKDLEAVVTVSNVRGDCEHVWMGRWVNG